MVLNRNSNTVLESKEKINVCEKYIEVLFQDNRPLKETENSQSPKKRRKKAIHNVKNKKNFGMKDALQH